MNLLSHSRVFLFAAMILLVHGWYPSKDDRDAARKQKTVFLEWVSTNGVGAKPGNDDEVQVLYEACHSEGKVLFYKSEKYNVDLGDEDSDVIKGLRMAIKEMRVGDRCRIFIPSELAYGKVGYVWLQDDRQEVLGTTMDCKQWDDDKIYIPCNADLTFDLTLVHIKTKIEKQQANLARQLNKNVLVGADPGAVALAKLKLKGNPTLRVVDADAELRRVINVKQTEQRRKVESHAKKTQADAPFTPPTLLSKMLLYTGKGITNQICWTFEAGKKNKHFGYKVRYFCLLANGTLVYYRNAEDQEPQGVMSLTSVDPDSVAHVHGEEKISFKAHSKKSETKLKFKDPTDMYADKLAQLLYKDLRSNFKSPKKFINSVTSV